MTRQVLDKISWHGEIFSLLDTPLEMYWKIKGMVSPFTAMTSANWRGYVAHWSIVDNRLFLNSVDFFNSEKNIRSNALDKIFPDCKGAVWAHWYSGTIRFSQCILYDENYRRDKPYFDLGHCLDIKRGVVSVEKSDF